MEQKVNDVSREKTSDDDYVHGNIFSRLYYGEYSLVVAYWLYGTFASIVISVTLNTIGGSLDRARGERDFFRAEYESPMELFLRACLENGFAIAGIVVLLLLFTYTYMQAIGQWRSASKYRGPKFWAIVAKIFSLIVLSFTAVEFWYCISIIVKNTQNTL